MVMHTDRENWYTSWIWLVNLDISVHNVINIQCECWKMVVEETMRWFTMVSGSHVITFQNLTCPLIEWHMLAARVVAKNYHHILWWDRTTCSNIKTFLSMIAKMFEGNLCDYSKCRRNCTLTSSVRFASQLWDFKTRWNRNFHDSQFANRRRHNLKPTCFDGQSCMHSWQCPQM